MTLETIVKYKKIKIDLLDDKKFSLQFLPDSLLYLKDIKKVKYKDTNLKTAYLFDIIHNLLLKYYFKKENLFNISSIILKEKYGDKYNYYIEYLVKHSHLKLVINYMKGKNARVYKLNDDIINNRIHRFQNKDNILLKKYKAAILQTNQENFINNLILPEVKIKLVNDLFNVQIDYQRSLFYLDTTSQDKDIYNKNLYSVEAIKDKHIFYHFDNYGRMHTNFTILKSFIRKNCLLINNEDTCEIDIKNSQPLFLSKLIQKINSKWVNNDEFELFKYLTTSGNFYQYLMDNSGITDKKVIKEMVYKVFFGRNISSKGDTLFKNLFPTIHNFIKIYKKESGNYKTLSHDLQKSESELIFNNIIKEVMYIYPHIKLITVHDSIICQKKYKHIVKEIFDRKLKEEIFL